MKSTYVGRSEIAHLFSQFQSSSTALERLTRASKLIDSEKTEAALELADELIQLVTQAALLTAGFHTHKDPDVNAMQDLEGPITTKAEQVRAKYQALLDKTNKENPSPKDVQALANLLSDNRRLELWRDIRSRRLSRGANGYRERSRNASTEGMLEAQAPRL